MPIRVTGLVSGLDTDAIIQGLVSAYSVKKDKYVKQQTKLSWKQDAWKDLNKKIYNLYSNTLGSLRYTSSYRLKKTSISDEKVATVKAASNAVNGTQKLAVKQLSQAGYLTGGKMETYTGDAIKSSTTLEDLGFTGESEFEVVFGDGKKKTVTLSATSTVANAVSSLKDAGLTVNFDENNQRIFVASQDSGKANDFSFVASDAKGIEALNALGLYTEDSTNKATYSEWEKYAVYQREQIMIGGIPHDATDENGNPIYKTDENGNKILDEEATKKNITSFIRSMNATATYNETLAKNNETLSAEIADLTSKNKTAQSEIDYLKLSNEERNAKKDEITADFEETFDEHGMAVPAKKQKYEKDEKGDIKLDDEGNKVETAEYKAALAKRKVYEDIEAKAAAAGGDAAYISEQEDLINTNNATIATDKQLIAENKKQINSNNEYLKEHQVLSGYKKTDTDVIYDRLKTAIDVLNGKYSSMAGKDAKKVEGQDAVIELNGVEYTSKTNNFNINGLTINTTSLTYDEKGALQTVDITTATDSQGIYDTIKNFFKSYNELINEMDKLYNADSSSGYEPLTDEEKDSMSDTEVEKWEEKIKNSLLRRDDTLQSVMSTMTSAMLSSFKIDGKSYSLSSFGIKTLGYFNAEDNEKNAYHIDGDADDENTKGNTDKLMAAISSDPDTVVSFFSQLTSKLYSNIDKKMKSSSMSSAYTVYNDKQMKSEYTELSSTISKWEEKIANMEEKYYKQFSAMETALSKLQSQTDSLTSMLGG